MKKISPIGPISCFLLLLCAVIWMAHWHRELKRERVFEMVRQRRLTPDAKGMVSLPASLSSASCDGNAYVTRRGDLLMVFLPAWFGKGSNIRGALMCNRTLTTDDVEFDAQFSETVIQVVYPMWLGPNGPRGPYGPATGIMFFESLKPNRWGRTIRYHVFNSLD